MVFMHTRAFKSPIVIVLVFEIMIVVGLVGLIDTQTIYMLNYDHFEELHAYDDARCRKSSLAMSSSSCFICLELLPRFPRWRVCDVKCWLGSAITRRNGS